MFFFFSSRRRHTILQGVWSSVVCSSDLVVPLGVEDLLALLEQPLDPLAGLAVGVPAAAAEELLEALDVVSRLLEAPAEGRSEERRVGEEGRSWRGWDIDHRASAQEATVG